MSEPGAREEELASHLSKEGLWDVYPLLIYQIKLCEAKSHMIKEMSERIRILLVESDTSNKTDTTIKIQTNQLALISQLFMFMEDYLSYSHYLRTSIKELPMKILSHSNVVWKEMEHLETLNKEGVSDYLLLPQIEKLPLSDTDKLFVGEVLSNFSKDIFRRLERIIKFYKNYHRVYIKYKHIFSPLIGTTYHDLQNGIEIPRIFIRDKKYDKDRNQEIISTYIISTDNATIDYYDTLEDDISIIFSRLLDCYVHSIQNADRPFLIPEVHIIPAEKKLLWQSIVEKVVTIKAIQPLTLRINVKETVSRQMLEALTTDHIFKRDQDILTHEENSARIENAKK
jgi:hypothetical protein